MTENVNRTGPVSMIPVYALALAVLGQFGTAIWWAGVVNARVETIEREIAHLRSEGPAYARELQAALRSVAVLEERLVRIDTNLARLALALERVTERGP
jgi:cell division protein FtsB